MINTISLYKLSNWFFKRNYKNVSSKIDTINKLINKCVLHGETKIGANFSLGYGGIGVVIHKSAKIGNNCCVSQNVTIGRKKGKDDGVPELGNNVYIGANSVVFGDVIIGYNCVVGPCTLINKSVPPNSVVAGNPFRVIKTITKDNHTDYLAYNIDYDKL